MTLARIEVSEVVRSAAICQLGPVHRLASTSYAGAAVIHTDMPGPRSATVWRLARTSTPRMFAPGSRKVSRPALEIVGGRGHAPVAAVATLQN